MIDALRGAALLGIVLLHSIEHFGSMHEADLSPQIFNSIDPYINQAVRFLFSGKAFPFFSLMFGFSFFMLMNNNEKRNIDFRWRFAWRLLILLSFGFLFSAVMATQILTGYALLGFPLILLYKVNKKVLFWLSLLFLAQIPTLLRFVLSFWDIEYAINWKPVWQLFGEASQIQEQDSFITFAKFNLSKVNQGFFMWAFYAGRLTQSFGFFILGLALGKHKFFVNIYESNKNNYRPLALFILLFGIMQTLSMLTPMLALTETQHGYLSDLIETFANLSLSASIVYFYIIIHKSINSSWLASYGRMSLTNYVFQGLISIPLFFTFGFGLYHYLGTTLSFLYGILLLTAQLYFSSYWMKHFKYGPLEWGWRVLTYWDFKIPIRRNDNK